MIVYGDPSRVQPAEQALQAVYQRLSSLQQGAEGNEDRLRALLIECGQLEQAIQDWFSAHPELEGGIEIADRVPQVTEELARLFLAARDGGEFPAALDYLRPLRDDCSLSPDAELELKRPEGPAFYALFPEQYALAARRWHEAQPGIRQPVLVVGIRSAGTALSAVVAAELTRLGWSTRRITVRPTGHPFAREVSLSAELTRDVQAALVVDEGPGLSGSSMAAVARALADTGMPPERMAFLPGHGGEPGHAASEEVRGWWQRVPRYCVPLEDLRWPEGTLPELLARATERLVPGGEVVQVDDLSWGQWRAHRFASAAEWPAAALPFERTKYRCRLRDGQSVLWKFEGLDGQGAERAFRRLFDLARGGWTPAPLGTRCGFVAVPWVEGHTATFGDPAPEEMRRLGEYVATAAGPPLSGIERERAWTRLRELLYWNTWEALGAAAAEAAGAWAERLGPAPEAEASYGDGRLAPWEWLREPGGRVVKVDASGHAQDHTAVGEQSVLWDLTGATVEWDLNSSGREVLLAGFRERGGQVDGERLAFYEACYSAFRMGLMHLCAGGAPDEAERARAEAAYGWYRGRLEGLLRGRG